MEGSIPLLVLSHVSDTCPDCLGTLVEVYADTFRDDYAGQPLIYGRDFVENIRFRRWTRFLNDIRELSFHGVLDFKKVSKDCIEVSILALEEISKEE